ncbi:MAG: hypothetical protein HYV26_07035 [Candidatus Hydrogenedentes bacterium]|nr:hypothetical protein [Candidatus Hydrogenedentota bacterium]
MTSVPAAPSIESFTATPIIDTTPIKIMCLGDSITASYSDRSSYRRRLWQFLTAAGYNVDFVGGETIANGGPPLYPDFDVDHEGHSGWRTDNVRNYMDEWAGTHLPDVVLIHLGTNDVYQRLPLENSIYNLNSIIDIIRTHTPDAIILLAEIIDANFNDMNGDPMAPGIAAFNTIIPGIVRNKNTLTSPVVMVDQYLRFYPQYLTSDGLHPNAAGDAQLAERWYEALWPLLEQRTRSRYTLAWETAGATSVDIQPGIGAVAPDGSLEVSPETATTYTLTANGSKALVTAEARAEALTGGNNETLFFEDFEQDTGGFVIDNAFPPGNGLWHRTNTACQALNGFALYYGQDGACDYDAGNTSGAVYSPPIDLAAVEGPISLRFQYFLETQGTGHYADKVGVAVSRNGGPFENIGSNNAGAAGVGLRDPSVGWRTFSAELGAYAGALIQVRIRFSTENALKDNNQGLYPDNFAVIREMNRVARLIDEDFEQGLGQFTILNGQFTGAGLWHLSDACQAADLGAGNTALYYGRDAECDFDAGNTDGIVYTGPISLAGMVAPVILAFDYLLVTQGTPHYADMANAAISVDNAPWQVIAHNNPAPNRTLLNDPSAGWRHARIDLSAFAGSQVKLRFGFKTVDDQLNLYPGYFVDNVRLLATLPPARPVFLEDFAPTTQTFTLINNFGAGPGLWNVGDTCAPPGVYSAPHVLYYGRPAFCDYDAGNTAGVMVLNPIPLRGMQAPLFLTFRYALKTQGAANYADLAAVAMSTNGGPWTNIAHNNPNSAATTLLDTDGGWQTGMVNISSLAGTAPDVKFRLQFRTVTAQKNQFPGFHVDDVRLWGN